MAGFQLPGKLSRFLKMGRGLFLGHPRIIIKWTWWVFFLKICNLIPPPSLLPTIVHRSSIGGSWILRGGVLSAPHGYTIQKMIVNRVKASLVFLWCLRKYTTKKWKKTNKKSTKSLQKLPGKARQKQLQSAGLLFPHMFQKIDLFVF